MTLIITLPTAFSQKKRTQQKVDSLWRKYQELRKLEAQRLAGFDYLLQSDHLETKQNGVFLQEARAGDTVTKTDGTVSLKGHTSTGGAGVAIGPVGVGGAESFSRMKGTMESTGRSKQGDLPPVLGPVDLTPAFLAGVTSMVCSMFSSRCRPDLDQTRLTPESSKIPLVEFLEKCGS